MGRGPSQTLTVLAGLAAEGRDMVTAALTPGGHWVSEGDLTRLIKGAHDVVAALCAAETAWIARYAALTVVENDTTGFEHVDRGVGFVDEFASDTLAPLLGMSHGAAGGKVRCAAKLAADLPETLAALARGELDLFRAQCIAEELADADHETCALVEKRIHPAVGGDTPMKARNRVRRALAAIDPDLLRERAARAKLDRFVSTRASHLPGLTQWYAQLPAEDSAKAWAAIDALAHQKLNDDPTRTLNQHRADALLDLILGNATIQAHLTIAIPITPDTGGSPDGGLDPSRVGTFGQPLNEPGADEPGADEPGAEASEEDEATSVGELWAILSPNAPTGTGVEIPNIGVIPAPLALSLAGTLGARITRMLVDPKTGTTIETSAASYRPTTAIAKHVRLRDGTCRFPNCSRRAERCEIDHLIPWPGGPTSVRNLICLCKHHHRLKHGTAWKAFLAEDGTVTWTDPYGDEYVTYPVDYRLLATA